MEEKTTTNEDNDALETPLINGRREYMELEQVSLETNADESIWLKILCFLGFVYPILRENGKCKCNWKTIGWSIVPFVETCFTVIITSLSSPYHSSTFQKVWNALGNSLILLLSLSLSYTRKRFSDAIVGEENRVYINTVAKKSLMLSPIGGVIVGVGQGVRQGVVQGVSFTLIFTVIFCQLAVVILRCLFLAHTSVTQVKTELLEMVKGTEVGELQTKLLEISKMIQEASVGYLQVPLSVFFVLGMHWLVGVGITSYKYPGNYYVIYVIFGTAMVTPLWLLTRIEKFYLWTLRELLHRNTVMPRTEQTNLLAKYDTIAPRASVFGIYITRGRVASIILAIFGSIAPKIAIYLYQNLG
eukprot:g2890.t1